MKSDETHAISGPEPAPGTGSGERVTRAVWWRLSAAAFALAAGIAALVIAVELIRSTLS